MRFKTIISTLINANLALGLVEQAPGEYEGIGSAGPYGAAGGRLSVGDYMGSDTFWKVVMEVIGRVENQVLPGKEWNPADHADVVGDKDQTHHSYGIFQMTEPYVKDAVQHWPHIKNHPDYTGDHVTDVNNPVISSLILQAYMDRYLDVNEDDITTPHDLIVKIAATHQAGGTIGHEGWEDRPHGSRYIEGKGTWQGVNDILPSVTTKHTDGP